MIGLSCLATIVIVRKYYSMVFTPFHYINSIKSLHINQHYKMLWGFNYEHKVFPCLHVCAQTGIPHFFAFFICISGLIYRVTFIKFDSVGNHIDGMNSKKK